MNQSFATVMVKGLIEKHLVYIAEWLNNKLNMPLSFARPPSYPGFSVAINATRVLIFNCLSQPLNGEDGDYARVMSTNQAACFDLNSSSKGPMVTIDIAQLALDAKIADIPIEAFLEILVLHETVHVCMMGSIVNKYPNNPWVVSPEFAYIHEAVALKFSEFGLGRILEVATAGHVAKYLMYVETLCGERTAGANYQPYFDKYRAVALDDFWLELRSSQPAPGIFEMVENLKLT